MRWIETIWLRSGEGFHRGSRLEAFRRIEEIAKAEKVDEIHLYSHGFLKGDVLIELIWNKRPPPEEGSPAAVKIKDAIDHLGLTHYNIWKKEELK